MTTEGEAAALEWLPFSLFSSCWWCSRFWRGEEDCLDESPPKSTSTSQFRRVIVNSDQSVWFCGGVSNRAWVCVSVSSSRFRRTDPPASEKAAALWARLCRKSRKPIRPPIARQAISETPELFKTATRTFAEVSVRYL